MRCGLMNELRVMKSKMRLVNELKKAKGVREEGGI